MADRAIRLSVGASLLGLVLSGCAGPTVSGMATAASTSVASTADSAVTAYFDRLNQTGTQGADAQAAFFAGTQDPDAGRPDCGLAGLTLQEDPAMGTLQLDPSWTVAGTSTHPRGTILQVAVSITIRRADVTVGNQIGTEHLVLLGDSTYGFAPCFQ